MPKNRRMHKDRETNRGWWTDKPERQDGGTFFAPIVEFEKDEEEHAWMKGAVVLTIMIAFGVSLLRFVGLVG